MLPSQMRLVASDLIVHRRPTPCDLRVWLRHQGYLERQASAYEQVLRRLGERHELEHLVAFGGGLDLSQLDEEQRLRETLVAIADRAPLVYQPAFRTRHALTGTNVEILGMPDFLIGEDNGYIIREAKMARRIDEENHPEILLQLQLYGWLFEKSCGIPPRALQVFNGMREIIPVPYDGGVAALTALQKLVAIEQQEKEAYEPVIWSKCNPCGYNERCWNRAEANGDVSLLPDVDQSLARTLNAMGIRTRTELLDKFDISSLGDLKRPIGSKEQRVGKKAERILQFAESMEKREVVVLAAPAIPRAPNYVMFDLEGMPPHLDELDKIYMWGVQVFGEKPSEFTPAVSGFGPEGDRDGWLAFLQNGHQVLETYGNIPFVHWASYEKTYIAKYVHRYGDVGGVAARVTANLLDLFTITKASLILPVPSFSLKVIEQYVGYKRKQDEYDGRRAMATFIEATETCDDARRRELMDEILAYNREDLEAMWVVFQWLRDGAADRKKPLA